MAGLFCGGKLERIKEIGRGGQCQRMVWTYGLLEQCGNVRLKHVASAGSEAGEAKRLKITHAAAHGKHR